MSNKRHQARRHALQALYQWQMTGDDLGEIINQFLADQDTGKFDVGYFRDLGLTYLHLMPLFKVPKDPFAGRAGGNGEF